MTTQDQAIEALLTPEPIDLAQQGDQRDQPGPGDKRRARYRIAALATAALFLAAVVGLAVMADTDGPPPTPEKALAQVRGFVGAQRTATFTGFEESSTVPTSGELGDSYSHKSRLDGRVRLPGEAYVRSEDGDFVEEALILGDRVYIRSADDQAALAAEKWVSFDTDGPHAAGAMPGPGGETAAADAAAVSGDFMNVMGIGAPIRLDELLGKLQRPERPDPAVENRLRATAKLEELLPPEVKEAIDKVVKEAGPDDPFPPIDDTTVTVTIEYGPDGRLDLLLLESAVTWDDERTTDRYEFRFADWGRPVDITAPGEGSIDKTPHIDEEGLAEAQKKFPVLAPTAVPAGWKLQALDVYERDEEDLTCDSVELEYGPDFDFDAGTEPVTDDDMEAAFPPTLSIASVRPDCEWHEDNEPDMTGARTVQIGRWKARIVNDAEDNTYTALDDGVTAVMEADGVRIVASTDGDQAVLINALKSLGPIDLAKQPIGQGDPFGAMLPD